MSFSVVGHVTRSEGTVNPDTGEIRGGVVVLNGWREGFTCYCDADLVDILPPVGSHVELVCRRNSWKTKDGYGSNHKLSSWSAVS